MSNRIAALILCCACVASGATSSNVVVTGQTGSPQTRPLVFSRVFKEGEIATFSKPTIVGVGVPSIWQNDVKTRWRNGSASVSVSGAANNAMTPATGVIRVTTATPHGFLEGELVTITGVLGNTAANVTSRAIRNVSASGFDVLNTVSNGTYTSGGTVTGPAPGQVKHVIITIASATVPASPGSITISFASDANQCSSGNTAACTAAGLDIAGMLAFNGGTWDGTIQTTASGVAHSANVRTMITAGACAYWQLGPAATSVVCDDGGARAYDFGYTCTVLCTANYTISGATGNGVSPIVLTTDLTNDLATGEKVTVLGVAGNTAANGLWTLGTTTTTTAALVGSTGNGSYSASTDRITRMFNLSTWVDDTTNKSLHPIFVATFFAGWAGVKIEYILQNMWSTAGQDQFYSLVLSTSAGAVYTQDVTHYAWTQWRQIAWDGSEPGGTGNEYTGLKIDYSLAYLIESGVILPYDQTMDPNNEIPGYNGISTWLSRFTANTSTDAGFRCAGVSYCGDIWYDMGTTGARPDIGPINGWDLACLYTWRADICAVMRANASNIGLMPLHLRESSGSLPSYDSAGAVASLGMPISMDSRRTLGLFDVFQQYNYTSSSTAAGDRITPLVTPLSRGHKFVLDSSHFPQATYVAYLTTGEWWHWRNLSDASHAMAGWRSPNSNLPKLKINGYPDTAQTRSQAWSYREILLASAMAPDGTAEQNYFQQKVNNYIAFNDGVRNDTSSKFYDPGKSSPFSNTTETSIWGLGRGFLVGVSNGSSWPNPLGLSPGGSAECNSLEDLDATVIPSITYCGKEFMWTFVYHVMHWAHKLGLPVTGIRREMAPWAIEQVQSPDTCVFCTTNYNFPSRPGNLTNPTLTSALNTTDLTIPLSSIPASWQSATLPYIIWCDNEPIKISAINVPGLTLTAAGVSPNGRAILGNGPASHSSGATCQTREYFSTWTAHKTGWSTPYATNFSWTVDYPVQYQAAISGYASWTSGGYTGQGAYDIMQTSFLVNGSGQVSANNNNPIFKLAADTETTATLTIRGKVGLGGKVVIH